MQNLIQIFVDAVALGSLYALVSLSIGLVFGVMRLINFAQADYITIGAYALVLPTASVSPALLLGALPFAFMAGGVVVVVMLLALLTERLAFRPMRGSDPATLLVSSFAVSYFLQHLVMMVHSGRPKSVGIGNSLSSAVEFWGIRVPGTQLLTMGVALVMLVAMVFFLKKTPMGIQMRAAAENFEMARLMGVNANRVIATAFAISGIMAAAVSLLLVVQTGTLNIRMGLMPVIFAFFATVIGGMGSLPGAALGGFIVGFVIVALQAFLPPDLRVFRDAFVFTLVIGFLLFRPQGIIVNNAARERV